MKKVCLIIIFAFIFSFNNLSICFSNEFIEENLNRLELYKYDEIINKNITDKGEIDFKFSKLIKDVMTGKLNINLKQIFSFLFKNIFSEIYENSKYIKNIIIVAILAAFFNILTESFKNKGIGEIGFYTNYILIVILIISSFNFGIGILEDTINKVFNILNVTIPILSGSLIMSGASISATVFSAFLFMAINFTTFIIHNVFIPLTSATAVLNVINYITPKEVLNKMVEFLKWLISFLLKSIMTIFVFIISIQRIGSPILNSVLNKTTKTVINFVPIIGNAMTGAIDGVFTFVNALKGGVGIGIFVAVILSCSLPIIKLISFIFIYKITAVIIEPISDKRITYCIYSIADYISMVLSTLVLFIFIFLFFVLVMLSISVWGCFGKWLVYFIVI